MKFNFRSNTIFNITLILTICSFTLLQVEIFGQNENSTNNSDSSKPTSITDYIPLVIAVISATGLGLSFWWSTRQFKLGIKSLTQQSYDKLRVDHFVQKRSLISDDVIQKLVRIPGEGELDIETLESKDKKKLVMFYVTEFDLYERLWCEYVNGKLSEAEWVNWLLWLEKINSPLLKTAMDKFENIFFSSAMDVIKKNFIDKKPSTCIFCNNTLENLTKYLEHLKERHPKESGFK